MNSCICVYPEECRLCSDRNEINKLQEQLDEALDLLKWYVENDDTNEGGKWEEYNAGWLKKKREAIKLLNKGRS